MKNDIIREDKIRKLIESNPKLTHYELSQLINKTIGANMSGESIRKRRSRLGQKAIISKEVNQDRLITALEEKLSHAEEKYKIACEQRNEAEKARDIVKRIKDINSYTITSPSKAHMSATAVALASDFHSEELVRTSSIDGLNEYNLEIANARIARYFQSVASLLRTKQKSIEIKELVLALLGDFITGAIHEEIETLLSPAEAVRVVQNHLASGIEYILAHSNVNIIIPCHSGNHGRSTKTTHQGNEHENSWEYLMYHNLAGYFRGNKRVKFLIAQGYHSFMDINGFKIRFHHGHNLKYSGGVGGIAISVRKAIAQWNKARPVDLDCFGHWHQLIWYGNFVCNGSVIGYNAFALAIKADYEKPRQAFFLVHHQRKEVIDFCPIWVE